ncbi:MAG: hypothetical protein WBZ19_16150 [Chthoniobacterales bacterium]
MSEQTFQLKEDGETAPENLYSPTQPGSVTNGEANNLSGTQGSSAASAILPPPTSEYDCSWMLISFVTTSNFSSR